MGPGKVLSEVYLWSAGYMHKPAFIVLSPWTSGQLSGEHGIGNGRLEYSKEFVGLRMIELHKAVKLAFDPNLILNPGKVVEFECYLGAGKCGLPCFLLL